MQRTNEISRMEGALLAVKKRGIALNELNPKLTNDILFAWYISRIQSDAYDKIREKYVSKFFIQESLKLFASLATVTISSLFIAGVLLLPIPSLVVLIVGSLLAGISGLYAANKIYQHAQGFFNSKTAEHELLLLDKILQPVAFGMQNEVEQLFTDVYRGNTAKIQEALRHIGRFTDYSGRTFNCTAYEYAYWAKDTHMCRMLERYMDEGTKAFLLERINANDANGLTYHQNDIEHRSAHFDFTPLKEAYQRYLAGYGAWSAALNWGAMNVAWLDIGKAQRNVPAHVAQEYCRPDRSFRPTPGFYEETLPRMLTFHYMEIGRDVLNSWFPLAAPSSGLGFDLTVGRHGPSRDAAWAEAWSEGDPSDDLAAITRLDEVRTAQLTQSREYLRSSAASPSFLRQAVLAG
jgi:hypothetical protein